MHGNTLTITRVQDTEDKKKERTKKKKERGDNLK